VFIFAVNTSVLILSRTFWYHFKIDNVLLLKFSFSVSSSFSSLYIEKKTQKRDLVAKISVNRNLFSCRGNLKCFVCTSVFEVVAPVKKKKELVDHA